MLKKISELTEASEINNSDIFPLVNNGKTKKVTFETIKDMLDYYNKQEVDDTVEDLKKQLEEENEILKKIINQTTDKTDLEEGTEITLENTIEAPFVKLDIEGNSEQESTEGRNLIDYDETEITMVKSANRTANIIPNNFPLTLQAGTYSLSLPDFTISNSEGAFGISLYYGTGLSVTTAFNKNTRTGKFTINEQITFQRFYMYIGQSEADDTTVTFSKIMLEKGNTVTEYEEYTGGEASPNTSYPQPIKNVTGDNRVEVSNKNLVPNNLGNSTISGINATTNDEGSTSFKGTVNQNATATFIMLNYFQYPLIVGEKYIFSLGTILPEGIQARIQDATNGTRYYTIEPGTSYISFTYDGRFESGQIRTFVWFTSNSAGKSYDFNVYPMLEKNSSGSPTPYVPYQNQSVIFPLSEGQRMYEGSYLADDGIHHLRGQYEFTGNEDFQLRNINENGVATFSIRVDEILDNYLYESASANRALLSHFINLRSKGGIAGMYDLGVGFSFLINVSTPAKYLYINAKFNTLDDFKTFLAEQKTNGTPVTIEYELSEETIEPYTEEQEKAWNEIKKLKSYNGTTKITSTYEEENAQMILKAQAYKSIKATLQNLEDRLSLLEN